MPNTPKKHAANFYLSRDITDRIKAIATTMDCSASSIVAMCIEAALPTIEALPATIEANAKEKLCPE
tara:strand:+ start:962 stop:1162 length:201 start_codon:yes stop_codon:yes gene_type:complete